ncbi:MAG: TolC family protein [Novosphingobium aromaticivorans]|nr:TolC family protein [Novosphingobium aromaticivorans]
MTRFRLLPRSKIGFIATALLSGCAHYTPLPLASTPPLAPEVPALADAPSANTPLSVEQVVALALANNPDLKAARLKRAVAAGQTKQAGILPNPSLSGAILPLISGAGTVPAWNIGLSQDIKSIITYKSRHRAARDSEQQVAADLVWQEWQVAGKARQLATDLIVGARSRPYYVAAHALLIERNAKLEEALAARNTTLTIVAPDRVALQTARTALDSFDQNQLSLKHQLNALLGLRPDAEVPLVAAPDLPAFDPAAIRASLPSLADRRPDLLALRLGYAAADETVRQAILAQFPDFVLGGSIASDNSKVINAGPNATLGLPIFDRNQGNVAIANATRAQLHAEYEARLAATSGEVAAMLSEAEQLSAQLEIARRDLPAARLAAERAAAAFGASNLDERGYVDLVSNRFSKEQEIMTLELALLDRQIAIQTLVGAGLPTVDLPPEPAKGARP